MSTRDEDALLFDEIRRALRTPPPGHASGEALRAELPQVAGYVISRKLSQGAQGAVYEAVQVSTKRQVALKLLAEGVTATERQRRRFEREVDVMASLRHPNIVTIYDSGNCSGRPYYAMELIDGEPLDGFLASPIGCQLGTRDKLALFQTICAAVSYAHQNGAIHRDLKPANIVVDDEAIPHLVDFGLAKATRDDSVDPYATMQGEFLGTLAYASPEQASGDSDRLDVRSDVYALGVILYELLTGQLPHALGKSLSEALDNIRNTEAPPPSSRCSDLDDEIDTIVATALHKDPGQRYASAEDLHRDIQRYLDGEPIEAKRASTLYVLRKSLRRHRTALSTAAMFVVVVVVALIIAATAWYRAAHDRDTAQLQSYVANLGAADAATQIHNAADARRRLDNAPTELRGWEWRLIEQRLDDSDRRFEGNGPVAAAAWHPSGGKIVFGDENGHVFEEQLDSDKPRRLLWKSTQAVTCLAYSPTGALLAVGGWHDAVTLLDAESGSITASFDQPTRHVNAIEFSADGTRLVAATGDYHRPGECAIYVWDTNTGAVTVKLAGHRYWVLDVAFHPNGQTLVSSSQLVKEWDLESGECTREWGHKHTGWIHAVQFTLDGTQLYTASSDRTIRVWDLATKKDLNTWTGHAAEIRDLALTSDGVRLVSTGVDRTVRVWNTANGESNAVFVGPAALCMSAAIAPSDDGVLIGSADGTARTFPLERSAQARSWQASRSGIRAIACSSSAPVVALGDYGGQVMLWDAKLNKARWSIAAHEGPIYGIAIDSDGKLVATAGEDKLVKVWDANGELQSTLPGHEEIVHSVAFNDDATRLVSGSQDRSVRVWEMSTGALLWQGGHSTCVHAAQFLPNGGVVSAGHTELRFWDRAGEPTQSRPRAAGHSDYSLAVDRSGRHVAIGVEPGTVEVLRVADQARVSRFGGHGGDITAAVFHPDGTRVVSSSLDGTLKVWHTESGLELLALRPASGYVTSLAFSPDGVHLFAGTNEGTLWRWSAKEAKE